MARRTDHFVGGKLVGGQSERVDDDCDVNVNQASACFAAKDALAANVAVRHPALRGLLLVEQFFPSLQSSLTALPWSTTAVRPT